MPRHICCACFTHNNLPCCNDGHVDHTGAQYVRKAWERSPLLRSVKANLATRREDRDRPDRSRSCRASRDTDPCAARYWTPEVTR